MQDVALSSDGQFALSGSWDGTLRLWDLQSGETSRRFVGHSKDVLSVAFSADNRQIVSGSRDKTINLWNTYVCLDMFSSGNLSWWRAWVEISIDSELMVHLVVDVGNFGGILVEFWCFVFRLVQPRPTQVHLAG